MDYTDNVMSFLRVGSEQVHSMQLHNSAISASYSVQALLLIQTLLWVAEQFDTPQTSLEISALLSLAVIIFPISLHSSHSLQVSDSKVVKDNASSRSLPLWISTIHTSGWRSFHSKKKAIHICCMHLNDFINRTCQTANKQKTSVFICDKAAMQVSSQV